MRGQHCAVAVARLQTPVGQQGVDAQAAAGALQLQQIGLELPVAVIIESCALVVGKVDFGEVEFPPGGAMMQKQTGLDAVAIGAAQQPTPLEISLLRKARLGCRRLACAASGQHQQDEALRKMNRCLAKSHVTDCDAGPTSLHMAATILLLR